MTATAVRSSIRRHVRVTIEGEAYHPDTASEVLVVVRRDGGKIVIPSKADGVTVEDIEPPRVWADGDVVQGNAYTYARRAGKWYPAHSGQSHGFTDATVTREVSQGHLRVLRYQAGEQ